MISPKSLAAALVDLICIPVGRAIDRIDWSFFDDEEGEK